VLGIGAVQILGSKGHEACQAAGAAAKRCAAPVASAHRDLSHDYVPELSDGRHLVVGGCCVTVGRSFGNID
jgi:hypothetical protein